jgi:AcrR family transcriptional regulator
MVRAGLTPDRLAQLGAELADEVGLDGVTVSAVARRVGVKAASLYSHIASSDELKVRITALALEQLADQGERAIAGRAGREAVAALANAYRDYAAMYPARYAASGQSFGTGADIKPEVMQSVLAAGRRHSHMSRAILRGYHLEEPDQTHAVRLIGSVINGFISLELAGGFSQSAPNAIDSWDRILEVLDNLLTNWKIT